MFRRSLPQFRGFTLENIFLVFSVLRVIFSKSILKGRRENIPASFCLYSEWILSTNLYFSIEILRVRRYFFCAAEILKLSQHLDMVLL